MIHQIQIYQTNTETLKTKKTSVAFENDMSTVHASKKWCFSWSWIRPLQTTLHQIHGISRSLRRFHHFLKLLGANPSILEAPNRPNETTTFDVSMFPTPHSRKWRNNDSAVEVKTGKTREEKRPRKISCWNLATI